MKKGAIFILMILACCTLSQPSLEASPVDDIKQEYVILLHGMGRTRHSMAPLQKFLEKSGYHTVNLGYPSTSKSVPKIAAEHLQPAVEKCLQDGAVKVHLVTHSLGGIVVRQFLQNNQIPAGSRVVMLAPPNQGSEVTDTLKNFRLYRWLTGPAGQSLGTGPHTLPNTLREIDIQVGIIAGDKSINPIFSTLIPGQDDGKVSVRSTKMAGMTDFIVIGSTHTFIMRDKNVLSQVKNFLSHGRFIHVNSAAQKNQPRNVEAITWHG